MAKLYADEQFPRQVVESLRVFGHDVLTVQEAGKANLKITDVEVLAFAIQEKRAVLTLNRYDFLKIHYRQPNHYGIIICRNDRDWENLAMRINIALASLDSLQGQLVRVNRF
jgi:predicted nuclease of predicted toxin-antitoxin system